MLANLDIIVTPELHNILEMMLLKEEYARLDFTALEEQKTNLCALQNLGITVQKDLQALMGFYVIQVVLAIERIFGTLLTVT